MLFSGPSSSSQKPSRRHQKLKRPEQNAGFSLLEILIATLISSLIALIGVPPVLRWADETSLRLAAAEVASALHSARQYAVRNNQKVAIKFSTGEDGLVTFAIYRDADRDGVRNKDIEAGIDLQVTPPRPLSYLGSQIRFGFPPGPTPTAPGKTGGKLDHLDDPIRFNRSDLASFSGRGTATPGTIYLTDGIRQLIAVRVTNRSGKISILRYDPEAGSWH